MVQGYVNAQGGVAKVMKIDLGLFKLVKAKQTMSVLLKSTKFHNLFMVLSVFVWLLFKNFS